MHKPSTLPKALGVEIHVLHEKTYLFLLDREHPQIVDIIQPSELKTYLEDFAGDSVTNLAVDFEEEQIAVLQGAFPNATLRIYDDAIPELVGQEVLAQMQEELGEDPKAQHKQRMLGAVRFVFQPRQLGIRSGLITVQMALRDLGITPDAVKRYTKLFTFCQGFLFRDKNMAEEIAKFQETPEGQSVPASMAKILKYQEFICPAEHCAPLRHLAKAEMLRQIQQDDEVIDFDSLNQRLFQLDEEIVELADPRATASDDSES